MEDTGSRKVNPYQFTIQFSRVIPKHRVAAQFLNQCGRAKSQIIADALEMYFEKYGYPEEMLSKKVTKNPMKKKAKYVSKAGALENKAEEGMKDVATYPLLPEITQDNSSLTEPQEVALSIKKADGKLNISNGDNKMEQKENFQELEGNISDLDADLLLQSLMGFDNPSN